VSSIVPHFSISAMTKEGCWVEVVLLLASVGVIGLGKSEPAEVLVFDQMKGLAFPYQLQG
jgi:hypothetical protein